MLCIDTLPVLILGYLFDKGVFLDTRQEVSFEDAGAARPFQSTYRLEGRPASGGAEALTAPWAVRAQA